VFGTLIAFRLRPPQDPNEASKLVKKSRNYMARKQAAIETDIIIEERAFLTRYRHIG